MAIKPYQGPGGRYRAQFKFMGKCYSRVVATREAAALWIAEEKRRLKNAPAQPSPVLMFSGMCAEYLKDYKARYKKSSCDERYRHLTAFAEYIGHDFQPHDVTLQTARGFISSIQSERGNKTANRYLRSLKACWNWHIRAEHHMENVWSQVEQYPEDEFVKYVPPPEDVAAVLLAASGWQRDFLEVLTKLAARESEILNLTWDDVNFERMAVRLWTSKRRRGERRARILPMSPMLKTTMLRLWDQRDRHSAHVFTNPLTGECYGRLHKPIRYMMDRLCQKAGVRRFGFHSLRHYTTQRLMDSHKATLSDLQRFLGHQRATTTDDYLKSISPELTHLAEAMDAVATAGTKGGTKGGHESNEAS